MMTNLFSIFDPSTNTYLSMNWISILMIYLYVPMLYWFIPSRFNMIIMIIFMFMSKEIKILLEKKTNKKNLIMLMSLFMTILMINLLGLYPYVFTSTSHMVISMALSISLWLSIMLFSIYKKNKKMLIHLTPQNTPTLLMPFMVLIETTSLIIRPLTLSIRLTANIIAGHMLMTLISSSANKKMFLLVIITILLQTLLMTLELAISFIQSYVFTVLSTLYSSEI